MDFEVKQSQWLALLAKTLTLMERKLRMLQIQGDQGRSRSNLLRALGNEGDGVSSAFPEGKQNREKKELL
jgi:DNA-binding phage protein